MWHLIGAESAMVWHYKHLLPGTFGHGPLSAAKLRASPSKHIRTLVDHPKLVLMDAHALSFEDNMFEDVCVTITKVNISTSHCSR